MYVLSSVHTDDFVVGMDISCLATLAPEEGTHFSGEDCQTGYIRLEYLDFAVAALESVSVADKLEDFHPDVTGRYRLR